MLRNNVHLILFGLFAVGLPWWGMGANEYPVQRVHSCTGDCYESWKRETGGVVYIANAQAEAEAAASPAELGEALYRGCVACHGSEGEGGIGPALAGQARESIYNKLVQYRNGETLGAQSALMWSQAGTLSDADMVNISEFVESLSVR